MGTRGGGGAKRAWREADRSLSPRAEVKNVWSYVSIPPHVFMGKYLIELRDNFNVVCITRNMHVLHPWFS
jgi:hypothetical protein